MQNHLKLSCKSAKTLSWRQSMAHPEKVGYKQVISHGCQFGIGVRQYPQFHGWWIRTCTQNICQNRYTYIMYKGSTKNTSFQRCGRKLEAMEHITSGDSMWLSSTSFWEVIHVSQLLGYWPKFKNPPLQNQKIDGEMFDFFKRDIHVLSIYYPHMTPCE